MFTEPWGRRFRRFGHSAREETFAFEDECSDARLVDFDQESALFDVIIHEKVGRREHWTSGNSDLLTCISDVESIARDRPFAEKSVEFGSSRRTIRKRRVTRVCREFRFTNDATERCPVRIVTTVDGNPHFTVFVTGCVDLGCTAIHRSGCGLLGMHALGANRTRLNRFRRQQIGNRANYRFTLSDLNEAASDGSTRASDKRGQRATCRKAADEVIGEN